MTRAEMNLRVFEGRPIPHVFFQPRIEPWYQWHKEFDCLPESFAGISLPEVFDRLGVSMRYVHYYTGMPDPVVQSYTEDVSVRRKQISDSLMIQTVETPHGELVSRLQMTVDRVWRLVGFPVKRADDLKKLEWLCDRTTFSFNPDHFEQGSSYIGDRGVPQFWVPKSPYQALCQLWMRFEDFIYALADSPSLVERVMRRIDRSYDSLYQQITACGKVRIVNFGENLHAHLFSREYFERYLLPWYEKRCSQLRRAGIYTHIHIDGFFRPILDRLGNLPFDGLEALTPAPQGDVTIEEIKEHIGDRILLDGIPAVLFTSTYSLDDLCECVEKLIRCFHPRLVLGISDEFPEGVGEDGVEKLRWVADYCVGTGREPLSD